MRHSMSIPRYHCREVEVLKQFNVVVTGVGGQGNLLLTRLIANSARKEGFQVQTGETLGMAQRGGSVTSFVRYGDEVSTPIVPNHESHVLISLEPVEALRAIHYVGNSTTVLLNTRRRVSIQVMLREQEYPDMKEIESVLKSVGAIVFAFDAVELGERAGDIRSANVAMLGGMAALGNSCIKVESYKEALKQTLHEKLLQVNLQAFNLGYDAVTSLRKTIT
jgi:indolepyruvate ferredoxin oxidoreductase beta subunit